MTKAIITTPTKLHLSWVIMKDFDTNLKDTPLIQAFQTPNKHLYIEYDENNDNLLSRVIDLDLLGLAHITNVEELEKMFPKPYIYYEVEKL